MALTGKATKFYDVTATRNVTVTGDLSVGDDVTIAGDASVTGAVTITGALTTSTTQGKANVKGNLKRVIQVVQLAPVTGAAADSTNYSGWALFGRAGTVTAITLICDTAPTVGTDVFTAKKASASGNTMLNAANYNVNSLTANTAAAMTLTATAADLQLTAAQGVHLRYAAGTQTVDAINVAVAIEFEPDDY